MRYAVIIAGWLWGLAALPALTDAGPGFLWPIALFLAGALIGLMWVGYSCAIPTVFRTPRVRWSWVSVPAIGLCGVALGVTHRDLALRVRLCDSELHEYAESIRKNPEVAQRIDRRWVGLFEVEGVSADESQVKLYTAQSGFMDSAGIVYRPDGAPPEYTHRHQHLYGPWWWFWERF